ncbi:MAG: hypothetical protein D6732_24595 [Methanobacteriota archaeon]|nr:MAG: hypothetical protein D6732_24595 [Euryarchaeota archaeon]
MSTKSSKNLDETKTSDQKFILWFLFIVNLLMLVSLILGILLIYGRDVPSGVFQVLGVGTLFILVTSIFSNKGTLGNYFLNALLLSSTILLVIDTFMDTGINLALIGFWMVVFAIIGRVLLLDRLFEAVFRGFFTLIKGWIIWFGAFLKQLPKNLISLLRSYQRFIMNDPLTALEYHLFLFGVILVMVEFLPVPNIFPIDYWIVGSVMIVMALFRDLMVIGPKMARLFWIGLKILGEGLKATIIEIRDYILKDPSILLVGTGIIGIGGVFFVEEQFRLPLFVFSVLCLYSFDNFKLYRMLGRFAKSVAIRTRHAVSTAGRIVIEYNLVPTFAGIALVAKIDIVQEKYRVLAIGVGTLLIMSFNRFWILRLVDRLTYYMIITGSLFRRYFKHFANRKVLRAFIGLSLSLVFFIVVLTGSYLPWWISLILSFLSFSLSFDTTTQIMKEFGKSMFKAFQNQRFVAYFFGYTFLTMSIFNFWIPDLPYARPVVALFGLVLLGTVNRFFRFWIYTLPKNILMSIWNNLGGFGQWMLKVVEAILSNIFLVLSFFLGIAGIIFGILLILSGTVGGTWFESFLPDLPELQTIILGGMMVTFGILMPRYTYARREDLKISGIDLGGPKA